MPKYMINFKKTKKLMKERLDLFKRMRVIRFVSIMINMKVIILTNTTIIDPNKLKIVRLKMKMLQ